MHRSRILFWALIAFLAGVGFTSLFLLAYWLFLFFSGALAVFVARAFLESRRIPAAIILGAFLFGIARGVGEPVSFAFLDTPRHSLEAVRDGFIENISRALPEPQAAYLAGITVGARSDLPYDIKQAFRQTGTSHIIALSGYNVTIVAEYMAKLFGSVWLSVAGIILFVLATGAASSVVRAAIMGVLVLVARSYGRDYNIQNSLLVAVALMVFADPSILFGDIGFQLSVGATAGLVWLEPRLTRHLSRVPKRFGIRESLSATLAAQAATLPLILYYFGRFSILSPLVNVLVLGAIPATMFFGFVIGVTGFLHPYIALIAAWPAYLLLSYQLWIIQFFATLGF